MSGICGELTFDSSIDTARDFERLIDMMAWRGPDNRGSWSNGPCRLGFRRLSVLDLSSAANQPLVAQERYALVFNGEVYNFCELRNELEHLGVTFSSSGDSEVVLQALIHWGVAALDRFNGMFALAFYDVERRSLLLARDPLGVKPLYVLQTGEGLFFASQYDQILVHPWAARLSLSPDALGLYLRLGYVPAPYGIFKNTMMLEPGSWLEVDAHGGRKRGRYYSFPVYQEPDLQGDEAFEAIDAALESAVRRQMVSDVPIGTFLSGGIDSPLISAKAALASSGPLKAFTIGNESGEADESVDAQAYAQSLGLKHFVECYTPDKALQWLERVVDACGEPMADISMFSMMLLSNLARGEVSVSLSGDGGDELFWGYADRFGAVIGQSEEFKSPRWLRAGRRASKRLSRAGGDFSGLNYPTIGDWTRGVNSRLAEPVLGTLFNDLPEWPAEFDLYRYDGWQPDRTAQWLRWSELNGNLARVLLQMDRASMFHSLEVRAPFLDREVLAVAARVDWRSCLTLGEPVGKLPLRRALAKQVDLRSEPQRGFSVPMDEWLRGPLLPVFHDSVLSRMEILGLPLNRVKLTELLNEHVAGRADYSPWLWALLFLSLWTDKHLER